MAAAADSVKRIKAEATCSICLELLRNPVTTACGHSFCKRCIALHHKGHEDFTCPQCRQRLQTGTLRPNQDLKKIVELFSLQAEEKPAGGNMCKKHQEPLKLYCKEDQSPICLVCRESKDHRGHKVAPMEEAIEEYRGKMAEQLGVIKSSCGKLHQFVSEIWKHLPQNEQDEERRNLAGVSEKFRGLQVHTGTPKERFADKASQTRSPSESDSSESEVSKRTERRGRSGREPGSEPAAEKQEETRTHVGHVCEEAPAPKYGLDQASLDPVIHKISGATGDTKPKVDAQQTENRPENGSSPTPAEESGGSSSDATSASSEEEGNGDPAGDREQRNPLLSLPPGSLLPPMPVPVPLPPQPPHQTERQGRSGREPGSETAAGKREETGGHVGPVGQKDPTSKRELSQGSLDKSFHTISGARGDAEPKVAVKEPRKRQMENRSSSGRRNQSSRRGTAASSKEEER